MQGNDYAVWLMPGLETRRQLRELVQELAQREGSPVFEPHMTVLHRVEGHEGDLCERLTDLAGHLTPMTLTLGAAQMRDEYFRCLYLPVYPTDAADRVRHLAIKLFKQAEPEPFEPHFSLLYGDIEGGRKGRIIDELTGGLPDRVHCDQLALYRLTGTPDMWAAVRLIDL